MNVKFVETSDKSLLLMDQHFQATFKLKTFVVTASEKFHNTVEEPWKVYCSNLRRTARPNRSPMLSNLEPPKLHLMRKATRTKTSNIADKQPLQGIKN